MSLQMLSRLEYEDNLIRKQTLQLGTVVVDFNAERGRRTRLILDNDVFASFA